MFDQIFSGDLYRCAETLDIIRMQSKYEDDPWY